jgi:hypothetical protein
MTKISALSDIGTSVASNDAFVLVDVSDPTTPNKKIQQQNLLAAGGLLPDGSAGTPGLRFTSDTNVGLFRPTTDTLGFATGGSERLRIDSSGRVGIGTSSPINTLHVNGTGGGSFTSGFADALALINATTNTAGQGAALALTALATKETAWIISAEHTSGNNGDLAFYGYPGGASYAERMRITSAGNVGIGTTSPVYAFVVSAAGASGIEFGPAYSGTANLIQHYSRSGFVYVDAVNDAAQHRFQISGTERARIDSSGRLLVGTSTARAITYVTPGVQVESINYNNASQSLINNSSTDSNPEFLLGKTGSSTLGSTALVTNGHTLGVIGFAGADGSAMVRAANIAALVDGTPGANDMPGRLVFSTTADGASSPTERMRINAAGAFKASLTGTYDNATSTYHELRTNTSGDWIAYFTQTTASNPNGVVIKYSAAAPNNPGSTFLYCEDTVGIKASIRSNGGIANFSANDVNLSDINSKKDISPAVGTWDCIKEWEIVNYRYKDQPDDADLNLGVIAQQVAESCPEVITVFEEAKEATEDAPAQEQRLGVKEQQMYWMAIKALQEAQVRIEQLESKVAALESA